jgi:LCP family protein required for cell wall assembly
MQHAVENVTGLDIPYWTTIDFDGFRKIIDNLGGVDVVVDKPFTDRQYPTYNYGYQTVRFEEGPQHLNGERALQYARSRHGTNGTGSDFDRSRRQKVILDAIKQKALSVYTLFNPTAMSSLLGTVSEHARTNIELWEMARFWEISQSINTNAMLQLTIDNGSSGLLHSERGNEGAYTLVPNAGLGNYKEIRAAVKNIFSPSAGAVAKESAKIELQNGTKQSGLAMVWKDELSKKNYQIVNVGNAARTDYERTVIYDLTGQFPETLKQLKADLNANVSTIVPPFLSQAIPPGENARLATEPPDEIPTTNASEGTVDLIIVLGADHQKNNLSQR